MDCLRRLQLAKVEEEVSSHLASQQELAFKVREAEDKVLALSNSLSTANADLLNAQSAIDELQDSLGNQERRLNAEHAATINSLKEHKAQTMLLQTEKDSLAERVGELEELVRELMRDSSEMEDKLRAALETKSAELECRDDLRKLEALDSGLVRSFSHLQSETADLQAKVEQAKPRDALGVRNGELVEGRIRLAVPCPIEPCLSASAFRSGGGLFSLSRCGFSL